MSESQSPSPNSEPVALIFLGGGLAAEVDREDADLRLLPWRAREFATGGPYAFRGGVSLHRKIAARMGLEIEGRHVDHINGDTLDNRRSNLRAVSAAVNARNTDKLNSRSTTGYRGVTPWTKGRFRAQITTNSKARHIGIFSTAEAANAARLAAEAAEWGIEPRRAEAHAA